MQSSRWQRIAAITADRFESYVGSCLANHNPCTASGAYKLASIVTNGKAKQREADEPLTKGIVTDFEELSGQKFATVYADPPWQYGNQATRASTNNHYGTMTVDEICALPVADVVADDAQLHLWTTSGFLFDAKRVIDAWGFEYRSCFVWCKTQMGIGNYWRVSHEFLLLAIRGSATFEDKSLKSWGEFSRGRHSAKPKAIRWQVERAFHGPCLELFGRETIGGWTVFGDQVERTYPVV